MDTISLETLQNFCRACLKKLKRQKCNIQSLDLQIRHWLQDATVGNPLANDTYPKSICPSCRNQLKDLLEFRQMCARSRRKVGDILENKEPAAEQIKSLCEETNTIVEKEDMQHELQVANFHTFDMVAPQDTEFIKSEPIKVDLEIEEPMICSQNSTKIKNEPQNADFDSFNYINNGDEEDRLEKSSDEDFFISGGENSDSERHLPKKEKYCISFNGSGIKDKRKNTKTKRIKLASNKKENICRFRCDVNKCKYQCISQQILDIHKRIHLGLKPYQCPKCDSSFDKPTPMEKHLSEIHGEKELNIICENCGKKFSSTCSYKKHYRRIHIEEKPDIVKTPYQHVCEECGKIFTQLQDFKKHQYTHGPKELYPFHCTKCDKAFIKSCKFKEHQMRHDGTKNFECPHCGAKKTTKQELKVHVNTHTKEKKYPCPNCPMIFYRISNLRVHVEVVHQGIRRFACRYCEQTFGKGDNLKNHELLHTGEKPHECKECGKRFVQKVSLRSHMRTHNK